MATDYKAISDTWVSSSEAARRLSISNQAMAKRIRTGKTPAIRISNPPSSKYGPRGRAGYAIPLWAVILELTERERDAYRDGAGSHN